jgi:hypothetical protein
MKEKAPYESYDLALEQFPDDTITLCANENGRRAIQQLMPETPIDWRRYQDLSEPWRYLTIRLVGPLARYDMSSLVAAIVDAGCSVIIKSGDKRETREE